MKIKMEDLDPKPGQQMMDAATNVFDTFNRWSAAKEGDSALTLVMKLMLKFTGVVLMILLSPFLVIGLTIAFIAVL